MKTCVLALIGLALLVTPVQAQPLEPKGKPLETLPDHVAARYDG